MERIFFITVNERCTLDSQVHNALRQGRQPSSPACWLHNSGQLNKPAKDKLSHRRRTARHDMLVNSCLLCFPRYVDIDLIAHLKQTSTKPW